MSINSERHKLDSSITYIIKVIIPLIKMVLKQYIIMDIAFVLHLSTWCSLTNT